MDVLNRLKERISAAKAFTTTGRSLVSDAIINKDNVERRDEPDDNTGTMSLSALYALLLNGGKTN